MPLPKRKAIRLRGYDYDSPGYYFITICTQNKERLLSDIVGTAVLGGPHVELTPQGERVEKQLLEMSDFYDDVKIEKHVIMPNHVHMLVRVLKRDISVQTVRGGPSRTTVPTSRLSRFVGTFKRLCDRACGQNIWQSRSYDHIIRDQEDYERIWTYIDQNPAKWREDRFYSEQE